MQPVVRMGLSPKASGLTRAQTQLYWGGRHSDLFSRVPLLTSYVQNHVLLNADDAPVLSDLDVDIFSEVGFESIENLNAAVSGAYYRDVVLPDERFFLNAAGRSFMHTRPLCLVSEANASALKLIAISRRLPDWLDDRLPSPANLYEVTSGDGPFTSASHVAHWYLEDIDGAVELVDALRAIAAQVPLHCVLAKERVVVRRPADCEAGEGSA